MSANCDIGHISARTQAQRCQLTCEHKAVLEALRHTQHQITDDENDVVRHEVSPLGAIEMRGEQFPQGRASLYIQIKVVLVKARTLRREAGGGGGGGRAGGREKKKRGELTVSQGLTVLMHCILVRSVSLTVKVTCMKARAGFVTTFSSR